MTTIKTWWLQIATVLLAILDLGFDVINPLLTELGLPSKWIVILKTCFGIYALLRSKAQMPSSLLGGTQTPINKDEK